VIKTSYPAQRNARKYIAHRKPSSHFQKIKIAVAVVENI